MTAHSDPDNRPESPPAQDFAATHMMGGAASAPPPISPSAIETQSGLAAVTWVGKSLGKYQITGILGRGGMGLVLKGHDSLIQRDVAIKILPAEMANDRTSRDRFLSEARAAGRLAHSNVVAIYEVGQEGQTYYLVMELVAGGGADNRLERGQCYSPVEATRMLIDACQGLAAAHAVGLVHRDVKPANLLRTAEGRVKVTDFGIVKELRSGTAMTNAGVVVGTPYFMSPEQCEGRTVDPRSDIYSLGATYYSLLAGKHPYASTSSIMQVMYAHCHHEIPDVTQTNPAVPLACAAIVQRAMAKLPQDRYQSAEAMLEDLQAVLAGLSGQIPLNTLPLSGIKHQALHAAAGTGTITIDTRSTSRRRFLIGTGLAGLGLGLGAAGWTWNRRARDAGALPGSGSASAGAPVVPSGPPIPVGVLHSLSGTMATSEMAVVDATLFAISEINQTGGLQGREIKPIVVDGRSDPEVFAREAARLIIEQKVCTVFGGWTSASRKTMKPVFEEHDHLLMYPVQYEGLETSPNILYLGAAPNQQILPAVHWALTVLKKQKFFFVGSDYVFPRAAQAIIQDYLQLHGGEIVGTEFLHTGSSAVQPIVEKIKATRPEIILNCINGDTNLAFFRDLREAGITPADIPTMSFSIGESELRNFDLATMAGDYAAWTYFQSIDSPANREFSNKFLSQYPQRVITDPMECAYVGVHLWSQAMLEAQSIEPGRSAGLCCASV